MCLMHMHTTLYAMALCPSVHHAGIVSKSIELVFSTDTALGLSLAVLEGNSGISESKVTSSTTLPETLEFSHFSAFLRRHIYHHKCCHTEHPLLFTVQWHDAEHRTVRLRHL